MQLGEERKRHMKQKLEGVKKQLTRESSHFCMASSVFVVDTVVLVRVLSHPSQPRCRWDLGDIPRSC